LLVSASWPIADGRALRSRPDPKQNREYRNRLRAVSLFAGST
jgi:hypothetical protein